MSYIIQSVIINKNKLDLPHAINWVIHHNHKVYKIDETENEYRFRQKNPQSIEKLGYTKYRTLTIDPKNDIKYIVVYK